MLAFANQPDPLFQAVVSESLERAIELLSDNEVDVLPDGVQALFGSNLIIREILLQLHQAHVDPNYVFRFTNYHVVLIYFCVDLLCETYAEGVEDGLRSAFTVQGSPVLELDAMELVCGICLEVLLSASRRCDVLPFSLKTLLLGLDARTRCHCQPMPHSLPRVGILAFLVGFFPRSAFSCPSSSSFAGPAASCSPPSSGSTPFTTGRSGDDLAGESRRPVDSRCLAGRRRGAAAAAACCERAGETWRGR